MPRTRDPYPAEFRQSLRWQSLDAVLSALHGSSNRALRQSMGWVKRAERGDGTRDDGLATVEHEELRRLRRENKQLRTERDILAKAATWFAQSDVTSSRSPNS